MESELIFSDKYLLNDYLKLIYLTLSNKNRIKPSIKTAVTLKLKLANKKSLFRFYKKLIRIDSFNNFLNSYLILSYCLFKRYIIDNFWWILEIRYPLLGLAFLTYHFLSFYKAIFMMKMIIEWFPIKNWDTASPFKRFLRRSTTGWTKPFEKYFPSLIAWIIVINIVPIIMSLLISFFITNDMANAARGLSLEDIVEFILESKLNAFR